jgi:flagellar hook-associated protein 2
LISASVFNPTSATAKLSISAKNSGYSNRLIISSDTALDQLGLTSDVLTNRYKNTSDGTTSSSTMAGFLYGTNWSGGPVSAESDENNLLNSKIIFNGITIQRDTNTISDVVNGITFSLKSVMSGSDPDVSIATSKSTTGVRSQIDAFISNFNSLYTAIDSKMYVSTTLGRGIFQGDTSANNLINSLRSIATSSVTGLGSGNLSSLAKIGITFTKGTGLTVSDSTLLNNSITDKLSQVEALFNSDNGIATKLYSTMSKYEGNSGSVYSSITRFNSNITNITDRITSTQARIDKSSEVLRKRYTALQTQLITILNNQSALQSVGMLSSDTSS